VQTLLSLCEVSPSSKSGGQPEPPIILLTWGSGGYPFECFCDSVNVKYTFFDADGTPLRATVSLSLSEVPPTPDGQNPTSGGVAGRRSHLVTAGDSLQSIAYKEYGRPALWRALAGANDIDDPMRLTPGTRLLIPPRVDAEAYA
jgi:nucleoid-associated protein YgaU